MIPAASLSRRSFLPSLRKPVNAARTLWTCHPVAAIRSSIAAPLGCCSRARIAPFFDGREDGAPERIFNARDDAALATDCCFLAGFDELRPVLRGCADFRLALRDLGMI